MGIGLAAHAVDQFNEQPKIGQEAIRSRTFESELFIQDGPATPCLANDHVIGDKTVAEEDLVEFVMTTNVQNRSGGDTGCRHIDKQLCQSVLASRCGLSSPHQSDQI